MWCTASLCLFALLAKLTTTTCSGICSHTYTCFYVHSLHSNSLCTECNELEPIPQQSNLRRGVVLRRKKGNRDSGRRSGTLVDAASLPPLPSSTATAAPSLVEMRAGRSATLRPTPTAVPLESANQRDLVKSELFVGKTVPVEYKLIEKHNIISVSGELRLACWSRHWQYTVVFA